MRPFWVPTHSTLFHRIVGTDKRVIHGEFTADRRGEFDDLFTGQAPGRRAPTIGLATYFERGTVRSVVKATEPGVTPEVPARRARRRFFWLRATLHLMARTVLALTLLSSSKLGAAASDGPGTVVRPNDADEDEVVKQYRQAAESGNGGYAFRLSLMYRYGLGVEKDPKLARQWLEKAAKAGQTDAQLLLGTGYLFGGEAAQDLARARTWLETAAAAGNVQAHALCAWMAGRYNLDRLWITAEVNDKPARFIFDTGASVWTLFPEAVKRLGVQIARPIPDITPPPGEVPLGQTEECNLKVCGMTSRKRFNLIPADVEGDGLAGWSDMRTNIFLIDAAAHQLQVLSQVPKEAASWMRIRVWTKSDYLIVELPGSSARPDAVAIDTGSFCGVSLSPMKWRQWRAAHSRQPATLDTYLTLGAGKQIHEEAWAATLSLGPLTLTGVPVREADATELSVGSDAPNYVATLGLAALKRLDLIIDGRQGWAYLRHKTIPPPQYQHNRLGAVFVPRDAKHDELIAQIAPGSPAEEAGIQNGDTLLRIGDLETANWRTNASITALATLWNRPAGTQFDLALKRGDRMFTALVVLREILPPDGSIVRARTPD
jgi:TPR repeat protein